MGKNQRLKVHRQWLPGRSLCSIRSNRKWCKRRGSSLECQNCFFVYPIIDSNLKNLAQQAQLLFDFMFQDISGSKHIGDFIVPQRGTALLSKDAIPGDIPVVAGGLVPSTYHNAANTVAPVITISSSGANAGFVNLWGVPVWSSDSSFIDFKMTPYVYFWHALLKRHQNNIYKIQTGSAQPHIYPSHIASLPVCDLDFGKVADYTERVTPLFTLISKNYKESNQLRALRDWLLPMLMNGQATISD